MQQRRLRSEKWPLPSDEQSFQSYMARLDSYFQDLGLPIPARQLTAVAEICYDLGENRPVPRDHEPKDGSYSGDDLIVRALRWYEDVFGDALKLYPPMPGTLVMLRGDPWHIRFPLITGTAVFFAGQWPECPALISTDIGFRPLNHDECESVEVTRRRFNVLAYIVDLPAGLRDNLRPHELEGVLHVFLKNMLYSQTLTSTRGYTYVEEALGDMSASVYHVIQRPPQAGLAQWSAHQALEKMLKSYLHHAGIEYPTGGRDGHNLELLATDVRRDSGLRLDSARISDVATVPSVRYDASITDLRSALMAHSAAMELGAQVAAALQSLYPKEAPDQGPAV